ncbi:hypothetical protein NS274_15585 [Pseudomonas oryzihabitans]|nr:hypothetical protein NS274_15585 [Pseudomonas psychrotolerans]KTT40031.1 hypothetical protein SB5_09480 [Pseudomonas psychrotolerans]KTT43789.1 hypothetical protein RSA46_14840 [Pseudomonas psychrotolerans]
MLVIRLETGRVINLERQVTTSNGYGIWEYHRSQSSTMYRPDFTVYRHVAMKPANPEAGQEVTVAICLPGTPEDQWKPFRTGVASFDGV